MSFPKGFMGFGTNPAFRSRSLVRSRIGAFRASDAGSNPAGSMLFYNTPQHSLHVRKCFRLSVDRLRVTTYSPGCRVLRGFLNDDRVHVAMAKGRAAEVRVRAKETVKLGGLDVTNRTANSITVKKTAVGLVVTNCCLEEQGM